MEGFRVLEIAGWKALLGHSASVTFVWPSWCWQWLAFYFSSDRSSRSRWRRSAVADKVAADEVARLHPKIVQFDAID